MTQEEKAKAYDKALDRAKELYSQHWVEWSDKDIESIFPELAESEDERIRKSIHIYLDWLDGRKDYAPRGEYTIRDMIAWLEKQGSKPQGKSALEAINEEKIDNANKVEPKFKVGDWVVDKSGLAQQVLDFRGGIYTCTYNSFITDCESNYHLWTIQDAKDGDVLLFEGYYNSIVLFQGIGINGKGRINYHCKCDLGNYSFGVQGDVACLGTIEKDSEHYHPATKEHRELLFKKMHEAGYTFDFDKKELKKIEQKPAWSEEDEKHVFRIKLSLQKDIMVHKNSGVDITDLQDCEDWLKSLKERINGKQ